MPCFSETWLAPNVPQFSAHTWPISAPLVPLGGHTGQAAPHVKIISEDLRERSLF